MVLVVKGTGDTRRIVSVGWGPYTLTAGQEIRTISDAAWLGWRKSEIHWNELLQTIVPEPYPLSNEELAFAQYRVSMVLEKFAKVLLLELNAIRAGEPRPQAVADFVERVKNYL